MVLMAMVLDNTMSCTFGESLAFDGNGPYGDRGSPAWCLGPKLAHFSG